MPGFTFNTVKPKPHRSRSKQSINRGTNFRARIPLAHKIDFTQIAPDFFGRARLKPALQIQVTAHKEPYTPENSRHVLKHGPGATTESGFYTVLNVLRLRHRQCPEFFAREFFVQSPQKRHKLRVANVLKKRRSEKRPRNTRIDIFFTSCDGKNQVIDSRKQAHEFSRRLEQRRLIVNKTLNRYHRKYLKAMRLDTVLERLAHLHGSPDTALEKPRISFANFLVNHENHGAAHFKTAEFAALFHADFLRGFPVVTLAVPG